MYFPWVRRWSFLGWLHLRRCFTGRAVTKAICFQVSCSDSHAELDQSTGTPAIDILVSIYGSRWCPWGVPIKSVFTRSMAALQVFGEPLPRCVCHRFHPAAINGSYRGVSFSWQTSEQQETFWLDENLLSMPQRLEYQLPTAACCRAILTAMVRANRARRYELTRLLRWLCLYGLWW